MKNRSLVDLNSSALTIFYVLLGPLTHSRVTLLYKSHGVFLYFRSPLSIFDFLSFLFLPRDIGDCF